jgi:hypothetical protein
VNQQKSRRKAGGKTRANLQDTESEASKYPAPDPTTNNLRIPVAHVTLPTLCYNDYYADEVCSFRDFRDATLSINPIYGSDF